MAGRHGQGGVKVVVTGPFAAGKSTLIRTISEVAVVGTERGVTDDTRVRKPETTVALDFGRITLDGDLVLHLFGTPGQGRFEFMWEVLGEGMLGYVLLVDAERPDSLEEAAGILTAFRRLSGAGFVVALNRAGTVDAETDRVVRQRLALDAAVPVLACDATDRASVKGVLLALLHAVAARLDAAVGA
jgi:uncharacterized protein